MKRTMLFFLWVLFLSTAYADTRYEIIDQSDNRVKIKCLEGNGSEWQICTKDNMWSYGCSWGSYNHRSFDEAVEAACK